MNELEKIIRGIIEKEGGITVFRFMELALQHPEHGYYRSKYPIGASGDFITSPEVSQMFGELVGLWCAETWVRLGKPEPFALLELGPGRGTMMLDVLRATAKMSGFHKAMNLRLLESDRLLREEQSRKLAEYNPVHMSDLSELPYMPVIVVANEFFDTMPIQQFVEIEGAVRERKIVLNYGELAFESSGENDRILEVSPIALGIVKRLSSHISKYGGAGLVIDYGYSVPLTRSTLEAVSNHKFVDLFESPGDVDITAHVDFTALRSVVKENGLNVLGPVTQGEFLRAMGIEIRAARLKHGLDSDKTFKIDSALRRLVDPSEMGNLFKVMGFVSNGLEEVAGFP